MDLMSQKLPNFNRLDQTDGTIFGGHNKVDSVNPFECRFIVRYQDNRIVYGKNLFDTGWNELESGFSELKYKLSTGHLIEIPKARAYKPLIEVSLGMDGSRIFHFINVQSLHEKEVVIYKIVLRQDNIQPYKIGDIIMSRSELPEIFDAGWKFTNYGG